MVSTRLIARNILRVGADVRCPHCGIRTWFHLDELRQFNECSGCGEPATNHRRIGVELPPQLARETLRVSSRPRCPASACSVSPRLNGVVLLLAQSRSLPSGLRQGLARTRYRLRERWQFDLRGGQRRRSSINKSLLDSSRLLNSSAQTAPQSFVPFDQFGRNGATMVRRMPFAVSCRWCSGRDSSIAVDLTHAHRAEAGSTHR